jgi:hypothetical protein
MLGCVLEVEEDGAACHISAGLQEGLHHGEMSPFTRNHQRCASAAGV